MLQVEETFFLDDPSVQASLRDELCAFLKSLGLTPESLSGPTEKLTFDAWLPTINVGVDIHDISGGRPDINERGYIREKHLASLAANVRYLLFFSDEWKNKRAIVESIIANAVGSTPVKLAARDCEVEVVTSKETKGFLAESHIQGATRASTHVVLRHPQHGIVGAVTIRVPIQKKYGYVCELARLAFKSGVSVRGGASKLIARAKEIAVANGFEGVLSYADLRFGTGGVYTQCGFQPVGETTINYWYGNGKVRYDRFKYRAQPGKPEKQVVAEHGVRPIWSCGHKVFLWRPESSPTT